jgi:HEPN domain-containing protein
VNYYESGLSRYKSAKVLNNEGQYQDSIYMSCLAIEFFIKSKLFLKEPTSNLLKSHDFISMMKILQKNYVSSKDLQHAAAECQKYFNESKHPHNDIGIFDEYSARIFLDYVEDIKKYIDNDC